MSTLMIKIVSLLILLISPYIVNSSVLGKHSFLIYFIGNEGIEIPELKAETTGCITKFKTILSFFSNEKQSLFIKAFKLNKDPTYCFDPKTVKDGLKALINDNTNTISQKFTNDSKNIGKSFGCILSALNNAKASEIDKTVVNIVLSALGKERGILNKDMARFEEIFMRVFSNRVKYLITTVALHEKVGKLNKDKTQYIGFIYSSDEVKSIVNPFIQLCYSYYHFNMKLLTAVKNSYISLGDVFTKNGCNGTGSSIFTIEGNQRMLSVAMDKSSTDPATTADQTTTDPTATASTEVPPATTSTSSPATATTSQPSTTTVSSTGKAQNPFAIDPNIANTVNSSLDLNINNIINQIKSTTTSNNTQDYTKNTQEAKIFFSSTTKSELLLEAKTKASNYKYSPDTVNTILSKLNKGSITEVENFIKSIIAEDCSNDVIYKVYDGLYMCFGDCMDFPKMNIATGAVFPAENGILFGCDNSNPIIIAYYKEADSGGYYQFHDKVTGFDFQNTASSTTTTPPTIDPLEKYITAAKDFANQQKTKITIINKLQNRITSIIKDYTISVDLIDNLYNLLVEKNSIGDLGKNLLGSCHSKEDFAISFEALKISCEGKCDFDYPKTFTYIKSSKASEIPNSYQIVFGCINKSPLIIGVASYTASNTKYYTFMNEQTGIDISGSGKLKVDILDKFYNVYDELKKNILKELTSSYLYLLRNTLLKNYQKAIIQKDLTNTAFIYDFYLPMYFLEIIINRNEITSFINKIFATVKCDSEIAYKFDNIDNTKFICEVTGSSNTCENSPTITIDKSKLSEGSNDTKYELIFGCMNNELFLSAYIDSSIDKLVYYQNKSTGLVTLPRYGVINENYKLSDIVENSFKTFITACTTSNFKVLLNFADLVMNNQTTIVPDLHTTLIKNLENGNELSKFGIKVLNGDCSKDIVYSILNNSNTQAQNQSQPQTQIICEGNCDNSVIIPTITIKGSHIPSNFQMAFGCLNKDAFVIAYYKDSNEQNQIFWKNKTYDIGKDLKEHKNTCFKAFTIDPNLVSAADKKTCQGNLDTNCSDGVETACAQSGLKTLITNSTFDYALPIPCDPLNISYSEQNCFKWFVENCVNNSMIVNIMFFDTLFNKIKEYNNANIITAGLSFRRSLRALTLDDSFEINDELAKSVENIPLDIITVDNSNLEIDGSSTSMPVDTNLYSEAEQNSANIKIMIKQTITTNSEKLYISIFFMILVISLML